MAQQLGWRDIAATDARGAHILIVDDDPAVRRQLHRTVTRLGYRSRVAESAEAADQLLTTGSFDAMLLDIELPRMSGVEFLKWALTRHPELAVIMLSGLDNREVALECLRAGARTYFVKPFELDFLQHALRDAVAMRGLLGQHNLLRESELVVRY